MNLCCCELTRHPPMGIKNSHTTHNTQHTTHYTPHTTHLKLLSKYVDDGWVCWWVRAGDYATRCVVWSRSRGSLSCGLDASVMLRFPQKTDYSPGSLLSLSFSPLLWSSTSNENCRHSPRTKFTLKQLPNLFQRAEGSLSIFVFSQLIKYTIQYILTLFQNFTRLFFISTFLILETRNWSCFLFLFLKIRQWNSSKWFFWLKNCFLQPSKFFFFIVVQNFI